MTSLLLFLQVLWSRRFEVLACLLLILCACLYKACGKIGELKATIAARPMISTKVETKVETKIETQVKTVRVEGPVRIVERVIHEPGQKEIVERVITRDAVTTTTGKETEKDTASDTLAARVEVPACAAERPTPRWIMGASTGILEPSRSIGIRGGVTIGGRVDLTLGYDFYGHDRVRIDAAYRF